MKERYIKVNIMGNKFYYSNKAMISLDREDGPACEYLDGSNMWYLDGKCHRVDGPAIMYIDGRKLWYLNGKNVTQEEHILLTKKSPTVKFKGKEFTLAELKALIKNLKQYERKTAKGNIV